MKRKALLLIISLMLVICAFAITAYAEEYYLVQSKDSEAAAALKAEGKTNIVEIAEITSSDRSNAGSFFSTVSDGASIEFILAENIVSDTGENKAILINKPITVTVKYNGYVHAVVNGSRYNGIVLNHKDAMLRLIGFCAMDENGDISTEFISPKIENGVVTERGNLDAYHSGKVYVWMFSGNSYCENMRVHANEEFVYGEGESLDGTYEFVSCASKSDRCSTVGILGKTSKIVNIDKGYYYGLCGHTVADGSVVKNAIIDGYGISIDSWHNSPQTWMFENCTVSKISTSTGRTHLAFRDCDLSNTVWNLAGDGWGDQFVRIYTSATCTEDGKVELRRSTNKGYPSSYYDDEINNYYEPKLGHESDPNKTGDIHYDSYLEDGMLAVCKRCGITMADENIKAAPLFKFLGYSTPEDGSYGIVASFIVDTKAISQYEEMTGKTLTYGIVAAGKQNLGDINPLDENGNAAILSNGSVVKAEVGREYASYDFVLTGMNENQLDLELVIASYVVVKNGDDISVVYLQSTQKTNTLSAISYNTIPKEKTA